MSQPLWRWLAPLLILLLAALLRLHQLGTQSLWNDEGNSVVQALRSLDEIAQHAARDIHPPGYYWLLHGWRLLTGSSEFALRLFSALASVLGVACFYAAGRWLYGRAAGLAAALFLALNGFSIWYAQETRMYALLALWGSAAVLALAATLARPMRGRALTLALINAAGLWTHYAWPYVLLAQGLVLLLWLAGTGLRSAATWHRLIAFIAAMGLALLLFLPWLPTALERVTSWPGTGVPVAMESALGEIFGRLAVGSSYHSLSTDWQLLAAMAALILVLAGLWPGRRPLWRSWLPLVWTLAPLALFLALGLYREANLKFLLPAQAGFALWAGRGFWWLATRTRALPRILALAAAAILASGMALALAPLGHEPAYQRADYRALVADISAGLGAQDLIVLNAPNQREVFDYYYRGAAQVMPMPPGTGPVDEESLAQLREGVAGARRIFALYWGETERDPQRIVERSLVELTYVAGSSWYGDVRLARYSAPQSIMLILRTKPTRALANTSRCCVMIAARSACSLVTGCHCSWSGARTQHCRRVTRSSCICWTRRAASSPSTTASLSAAWRPPQPGRRALRFWTGARWFCQTSCRRGAIHSSSGCILEMTRGNACGSATRIIWYSERWRSQGRATDASDHRWGQRHDRARAGEFPGRGRSRSHRAQPEPGAGTGPGAQGAH